MYSVCTHIRICSCMWRGTHPEWVCTCTHTLHLFYYYYTVLLSKIQLFNSESWPISVMKTVPRFPRQTYAENDSKNIRGQILLEKMWSGIPKFPYIVFKVYFENGLNSHWYLTRVASNARLGLSIFSKLLYFCMYFCM